ncbi:hypothetical protein [Glycomyces paridis]|uniref:Uncharacterized protein n=1 Tax=Glycomyces paridis TaxID=2126555 RepID=A0A4V4HMD3_9ACTN|nr:hypothetical protein [Glycomyces paridis]THV21716.1 hypothetical protein E9998_24450 [Glycomyces paridis]
MTRFPIERSGDLIRIGSRPPHPERTALVEARGALLLWDVLDRSPHPAAEIHDLALAADWLWEVYGPYLTYGFELGVTSFTTEEASPVLDAARALAHLHWAEAWWPASHETGVPALAPGLLRAETAWRTSAVEHLLDDVEAVERALTGIDLAALTTLAGHPILGAEARALAASVEGLAEDHGITLEHEPQRVQSDWALAAGGSESGDLVLASGTDAVDWALMPQGLADAAAEATWTATMRAGTLTLAVTLPAAPDARDLPLTARIAGLDLPLSLDGDTFTGDIEAPQGFMMLPAADRTLQVFAPGFALPAPSDPEAADRRAAILAFAAERLADPAASLTERAARP